MLHISANLVERRMLLVLQSYEIGRSILHDRSPDLVRKANKAGGGCVLHLRFLVENVLDLVSFSFRILKWSTDLIDNV